MVAQYEKVKTKNLPKTVDNLLNITSSNILPEHIRAAARGMTNLSLKIMDYYNQLNDIGKYEATKRVEELTYLPQYSINDVINAAHQRTDIEIPEDVDTSENDIMDDENF